MLVAAQQWVSQVARGRHAPEFGIANFCSGTRFGSGIRADSRRNGEGVIAVHYPTTGTIQNVQFSMATSSLPQGTYAVTELLSGATLGTLTIASNGGFSNFTPIGSIGAYATFLLKLKKQ